MVLSISAAEREELTNLEKEMKNLNRIYKEQSKKLNELAKTIANTGNNFGSLSTRVYFIMYEIVE